MTNLSLTYSFWWVFICLLVGGAYAWVQYTKSAPWSKQLNYILASIRVLLVAFICLFLLEPFMQSIINYYQKPLMVLAVDNSESIKLNATDKELRDFKLTITEAKSTLINNGFDVSVIDLKGNSIDTIDSLKFNNSSTDLSKQLKAIKNEYGNFNLSGVVLWSDGIFNEGYSPLALSTTYPIYTIGVGDTSKIKDLAIKEIRHNSTVLEGNKLLLEVHVLNKDIGNVSTPLRVYQKGKLVSTQEVQLTANQLLVKTIISIPITGSGKQSLTINLKPVEDEFTNLNNQQTIYFDVIDARKKILLLAAAPHPDLKAIKSSIEQSEYYEVELAYELPQLLDYDLVISHQYPTVGTRTHDKNLFKASSVPKLMIVGAANDFRFLRTGLPIINSTNARGKMDFVKPVLNSEFDKFQLEDSFIAWLSDLPPIVVPYGLTINRVSINEFLTQQIGNVVTKQPLLYFTTHKEQRLGVLLGINIWKWKLDEYRLNQTHENFDALVSKTVQYLSSNANKKRFYVNPHKGFYEKGEDVLFNTEEYNALFERVVGNKVNLSLTNENGTKTNYSFVPLNDNSVYKITGLPEGVYSYAANTEIDTKKYYVSGQFVVKQLNKEALNPVADFDLLRKLAFKSNASYFNINQSAEIQSELESLNPISSIHTTEKDEPLIDINWLMIMLILLATSEWFLRKFYGGY